LTIIASYLFYGWWDWRFLSLIIISSTADFIIGILLGRTQEKAQRKILLIASLIVNLGILGFFKYFNFFVESMNELMSVLSLNLNTTTLNIILPVGISFYTFQTLSYTIDVYKGKIEPTKDIISFFAFVSFFPQLVAGPIERASHLLKQFQVKKVFNYDLCIIGLRLVLWGFFKKIVIADNSGVLSDAIFNAETSSGISVFAGALFFALQIYADFSGYSDIAIGISKMLGFDLITNFKAPYFAASFGDFWHRWNISLSTWFRDYVYIPLGGNRRSNIRVNFNILITFLLSGLWHGANITFLIWGGLHGMALILEKHSKIKLGKFFHTAIVLFFVILFWIPFRAENASHLMNMTGSLIHFSSYSFTHLNHLIAEFSGIRFLSLALVTLLFLGVEFNMKLQDFNEWINKKNKLSRWSIYYILLLIMLFLGNFSVKPSFIYFQF
jgi:D-alanyl-lipoteichoic acid acyltransferase DltB (MBOAT superfamily)